MPNQRTKRNNYIGRFKSHTDINNYNNFLLELDRKQRESKETNINIQNTSTCNISGKREIDNTLNKITDNFINLKDPNFTGLSPGELILHMEPNLYEPSGGITPLVKKVLSPKKSESHEVVKNKVNIVAEVNNISDLLTLIETYPLDKNTEYNINMEALHKIKNPLIELNNMIGMKNLKENIVVQIIYYIQNYHNILENLENIVLLYFYYLRL